MSLELFCSIEHLLRCFKMNDAFYGGSFLPFILTIELEVWYDAPEGSLPR